MDLVAKFQHFLIIINEKEHQFCRFWSQATCLWTALAHYNPCHWLFFPTYWGQRLSLPTQNECYEHCETLLSNICVCSVMSDSATPRTVACQAPPSMGFPGKHTGVGCYFFLQGIFPTQGSKPHLSILLHWQLGSLPLAHLGSNIY